MSTRRITRPTRHPATIIIFVVALVASFFALAPTAYACHSQIAIQKVELGAAAPGDTYTIVMTDEAGGSSTVDVVAGQTTTIDQVAPGTYWFAELDAPAGATIEPNPVVITVENDQQTIDVVVTNPFPAGKLAITKVVTGDTAPDVDFTFDITGPNETTFSVDLAAGDTWTSDWLPLGTYTITERDAPNGHTITPNPVELTTDGQTVTVTATNDYRDLHGKLAITKVVTGDTAPDVDFTFDITGPNETTFSVDLAAGDTWTSDWLPLGTYTITERDAPNGHTITPNPVELTTDGQTVTVTATNDYRDLHGKLAITKVVTGDTAPDVDFTFDITGPNETTFSVDLAAGDTWTSDWLPLGTYTITERDAPNGHTITPNPVELTTDGQTVTVTATNDYRDLHGKLAITKVVTGDTAPDVDFTFDITGPNETTFSVDLAAGDTWTSDWLPLGTYTITERDAPNGHTITPNPVELTTDGQTVTVTATNDYRDLHGKLAITKVESGNGGTGGTYTMDVTGPRIFTVTVTAGDTWTSDWLPLGTYTITERNAPPGATIAPNPVSLLVDGVTVTVVVTNPTFLVSAATLPATGSSVGALTWTSAALIAIGTGMLLLARGVRRHGVTPLLARS